MTAGGAETYLGKLAGAVASAGRALASPIASVAAVGNGSRRVARVSLADGRVIAVKLFPSNAPNASRAAATLRFLYGRGALVPEPLAWGDGALGAHGWLAMAWAGDGSLDAALSGEDAGHPDASALGLGLVEAVATVEAAFAPLSAEATPHDASAMLRQLLAPWIDASPSALDWLGVTHGKVTSGAHLARIGAVAMASPLSVGPLDYHAGNVAHVEGGGARMTILDLDHVGWDWPARRMAQYGFTTGAQQAHFLPRRRNQLGGTFRSVLVMPEVSDAAAAALALVHGGEVSAWREEIFAHAVILVATAAWHLRQVVEGSADPARAAAWQNVDKRRAALRALADALLAHFERPDACCAHSPTSPPSP